MAFNADAFAEAHEPWTITLRGDAFTARELSADEVLVWMTRLKRAKTPEQQRAVVRRIWRAMFPWRWRYWWSGDPVARLGKLHAEDQDGALADFFGPREASQYRKARLPRAHGNA